MEISVRTKYWILLSLFLGFAIAAFGFPEFWLPMHRDGTLMLGGIASIGSGYNFWRLRRATRRR